MNSERINTKNIYMSILKTAMPEMKTVSIQLASISKSVHINTMLKGKTLVEITAIMTQVFQDAADKLGCDVNQITMISDAREGTSFQFQRPECVVEMIERVKREAESEANRLRNEKKQKEAEEKSRAKKIAQLESELMKLKQS